jgi:DNA topoisomerase-2
MSVKVKYEKLDPISHIHKRPDMYIGSLKPREQAKEWIFKDDQINEEYNLTFSDGLLRIYIEALSNAIDNVWRSRQAGLKPLKIKIHIDPETGRTSIWNDGLHILVEIHENENIYNPELIFGHLLSGSNLDDSQERLCSGRNGLGIKLLNVFSKQFNIEVGDPDNKKLYKQEWRNNMRDVDRPTIKEYKNKTGYTLISWTPDFSKFGMQKYDLVHLSLYKKFAMDASMITKLPIYFNDEKFAFKNFIEYVRLYGKDQECLAFSIDGGDAESEMVTHMAIMASPTHEYREIGFVNGIYTKDGGVHLDGLSFDLWKNLVARFKNKIMVKDLKPFFYIFVMAWVKNPEFNSQSKTKLLAPNVPIKIENRFLNAIMKWKFVDNINQIIQSKEIQSLKKNEKKQRGYKKIDGLDHANLAGTKESKNCTLILCEGLSAKTYAVKGINVGWSGRKGRDYFGIYALRGKLLNVRNANTKSIAENKEITDVIQALGLRFNVDYTIPENFATLMYGRVMILTDADEDGHHISSLIINFFHKLFPSLLQLNYIWYMMTPIAKIFTSQSRHISYYNDFDYQKALEDEGLKKFKIKYYKGLGTSSDAEIKETFGQKVVRLIKDDMTDTIINRVFNKVLSNERKDWLGEYNPMSYKVPEDEYLISSYINQELIKFSIEDCSRSIPNLYDGLKKSQRKILYSVFKKKLHHDAKSMKVAQLAGYCAESSNYHHGEQCLYDTITKMAQDFIGSNNIPILEKDGQFGSRTYAGKDAASARYIFTKCSRFARLLFPEEDDVLLNYTYDDGDKVEPDFYLPIIPTILANGCTAGIGTGWSCSVPCFNVVELIAKIKEWLCSLQPFELNIIPFYNHFKGQIKQLSENKFQTNGILNEIQHPKKKKKIFQVVEIPIGTSTNKYKEELEIMLENKKLKSLKNYSTSDAVHFEFEPNDDFSPNLENMKLISVINSSNMVLFIDKNKLKKFNTISEIFTLFCEKRLQLYEKRKEYMMKNLNEIICINKNKMRFLQEVENNVIKVFKIKEEIIVANLKERRYDEDPRQETKKGYNYLLNIPMRDFSLEKINELDNKILNLENELRLLVDKAPSKMWEEDLDNLSKAYAIEK